MSLSAAMCAERRPDSNEADADVALTELGQLVWDARCQGGAALERLLAMTRPWTFALFASKFSADNAKT